MSDHNSHNLAVKVAMAQPVSPLPEDAPPSYAEGQRNTRPRPVRPHTLSSLIPNVNIASYSSTSSKLSDDQITTTASSLELSSNPQAVVEWISQQANLPPKPIVRLKGWHRRHDYTKSQDFDIRISIMPLIIRDDNDRWDYVKLEKPNHMDTASAASADKDPTSAIGLDEYARIFCEDSENRKTFTLEREVINWDTSYIEGQLHGLVAKLNYKGEISVTFPTMHSKVVVYAVRSDPANQKKGFFNSLFGNMMTPTPKDYAVVKAVWPYATTAMESEDDEGERRRFAVQSEQAWWNNWKQSIQNAILSKRAGWVSAEDQLEAAMGYELPSPKEAWGKVSSY